MENSQILMGLSFEEVWRPLRGLRGEVQQLTPNLPPFGMEVEPWRESQPVVSRYPWAQGDRDSSGDLELWIPNVCHCDLPPWYCPRYHPPASTKKVPSLDWMEGHGAWSGAEARRAQRASSVSIEQLRIMAEIRVSLSRWGPELRQYFEQQCYTATFNGLARRHQLLMSHFVQSPHLLMKAPPVPVLQIHTPVMNGRTQRATFFDPTELLWEQINLLQVPAFLKPRQL